MTVTPTDETSSATPTASRNRRIVLVALAVIGVAILVEFGWAGLRLASQGQVNPTGVAVAIPSGLVTVESVEHALPSELGAPLPDGSHAVAVTLTTSADAGATVEVNPAEFVIEGTGVPAPIAPSRATPAAESVPGGTSARITMFFAVPDESTDLVLDLPGGQRVSAEHDDHPGDASSS